MKVSYTKLTVSPLMKRTGLRSDYTEHHTDNSLK